MWKKPWNLKEGFVIGGGLVATGLLLQATMGGINWQLFSWPANVVALAAVMVLVAGMHVLRNKVYAFRFMSTFSAAIPAMSYVALLTIIMGLTRQLAPSTAADAGEGSLVGVLGFSRMLSNWAFVLAYLWMTVILGLEVLKQTARRMFSFSFLFHLGLFVVLLTATLGNADMRRLKMVVGGDAPEWRALDDNGQVAELPLAIQLKKFQIVEYMPKLMLVDNLTGKPLGDGNNPDMLQVELDSGSVARKPLFTGQLGGWTIDLLEFIDCAQPVVTEDTTFYREWQQTGATTAVFLRARNAAKAIDKAGWLTNGSYLFPPQALSLADGVSLVMPEREPQRFVSRVEILTESGQHVETDILVNKPFAIEGWKIYQLNYDTQKGRWSDISILELVRDPWLPYVYTGIILMLLGAVGMFITSNRRKNVQP